MSNVGKAVPTTTMVAQSEFERTKDRIDAALNNLSCSIDELCCRFSPVLRMVPPPANKEVKEQMERQVVSPFDKFIDSIEFRLNSFSDGLNSLCERSAV